MRDAKTEARRALDHAYYAVDALVSEAWGDGWKEDGTGTPDRPRDLARYERALRSVESAMGEVY